MMFTIHLNDQSLIQTTKISEEPAQWKLSSEFQTA